MTITVDNLWYIFYMESLKRLFTGRLNRKYFALSYLSFFLLIALSILFDYLPGILLLMYFFMQFQLAIRRLHDMNIGGANNIVFFGVVILSIWLSTHEEIALNVIAALVSLVLVYILFLKKGDDGENSYGLPNQHTSLIQAMFNPFPVIIQEQKKTTDEIVK